MIMASNPFLVRSVFPDFAAMTPEGADAAIPALLADARKAVDALEKNATPGWETFVRPLGDATRPLADAWGCVHHLLSVNDSEGWRKIAEKYEADIVAFWLRVGQSPRFYALAKETVGETSVRKRILADTVKAAELSGVALPPEKRARFNAIKTELAELSRLFSNAVLDATKAWSLTLKTEKEVEGLPVALKEMTKTADGWRITVEDAVYAPFMKHAANREAREKAYRARSTRAPENAARIDRILALRRELAGLLGYSDYAHLSFATKSAPSVDAALKMVADLAAAAHPAAARENRELGGDPAPWDVAYFAERRREKLYAYSEEELSRYFDFPKVLEGLFALTEKLFGVRVEKADGEASVWHPDVRFFRVRESATGETIAHFYVDPYSRPETKRGGAWMNEFRSRDHRPDGTLALPLAVVCCNQTRPSADGTSPMRFTEVETLFHEFGHALQHMLTRVDDVDAAGLNLVEWDAVEICSQFLENWCTDAATLRRFARDPKTGEAIPEALIAKVRAAKNYRAGNATLRQLAFAQTDLELHLKNFAGDPNALKERVFRSCGVPFVPEDRFLNAFTHIFAGGYAAGYYGYKWSEVMSADVFGAFLACGTDEAALAETGRRYRDTYLALGGGTDPMEVFRLFRGRAPTIDAILEQQGLK